MTQVQKILTPDLFGAVASGLCLIHCAVTPFLFIAKACSATCCANAPVWWQIIDYLFIVISFFAIHYATKNSTKSWIRTALWSSWILLLITILSETFKLGIFPQAFIYLPALAIVILHFYNLKYCQCAEGNCCVNI